MEYILNQNFEKTKRVVFVACVVSISMIFGILNPLSYITDRDTPREISNMGKIMTFEVTGISYEKGYSGNMSENMLKLLMKKNLLSSVMSNNSIADVNSITNQILMDTAIISNKSIPSDIIHGSTDADMSEIIINPATDDAPATGVITDPGKNDVSEVVPGVIAEPIGNQDDVLDEPAYIEINGMKIDAEGYVTEIVSGVSDGLLVFPTDVRCTGIRAEAIEKLDDDLKDEVTEIWIPANITRIEEGAFDSLKNVNFIEAAEGNPAYYSEAGILYHIDGSLACMPQRRVR